MKTSKPPDQQRAAAEVPRTPGQPPFDGDHGYRLRHPPHDRHRYRGRLGLETLKARRAETTADLGDDPDPLEAEFDLPGANLSGEDLTIRVLPAQVDEFTCTSCYLVQHRSQLSDQGRGVCLECTA